MDIHFDSEKYSKSMSLSWDEEHLFFEGDPFYEDVLAGLSRAKDSIEVETYRVAADEIGRQLEEVLLQAVERGVEVRLLVDGIGSAPWFTNRAAALNQLGVQVRAYHPVYFTNLITTWLHALGLRKGEKDGIGFFSKVNRRDHRKLCIVDSQTAWVGSHNFCNPHSFKQVADKAWRDSAARVKGADVGLLKFSFDYIWNRSHTPDGKKHWKKSLGQRIKRGRLIHRQSPLIRQNFTARLHRMNLLDFTMRLRGASERIWITNPYLAPSMGVTNNLARAAKRGVDVRVMVPRDSDVFFMPFIATAHYPKLLKAGVRIFEYLPRFLHAKSIIIDDWFVLGTSNMNRRSLLHDYELDIVLKTKKSQQEMIQQFESDLQYCEEVVAVAGGFKAALGRLLIIFLKRWL